MTRGRAEAGTGGQRGLRGGLAVAALVWAAGQGLGYQATAAGLIQGLGPPSPVWSAGGVAGPPCREVRARPTARRVHDPGPIPHLYRVTDCTTEANRIPTNLQATGTPTAVTVGWTAPSTGGVVRYRVERSVNQGPFVEIAQPTSPSYTDTAVTGTPVTSYVYRVRADYGGSLLSAPSNVDVATTLTFTDDHALAGKTILAQHFIELRSAIGAVCVTAGETTPTWTDATLTPQQTVIKKVHIDELRAKASECLAAVGVTAPPFVTDPTLTAGVTTVKQQHVQELRDAVH